MKQNDALRFAHAFELKGVNLYMKLAPAAGGILAKEVFYSLAKQEVDHARRIDEINAAMMSGESRPAIAAPAPAAMEREIRKFFANAGRTRLRKDAANLQGYEMAMRMERRGYLAYKGFHENAAHPAERNFFGQMMAEEKMHYETLSNVYSCLSETEDWLQWEESRTWNWMNT